MSERIETLPKWAQRRIEKLERDIAYWKGKAFEAETPGETDTVVVDLSGFPHTTYADGKRGLPKGSEIRFTVARGEIEAKVEHQRLRIRGAGGERITVSPVDSATVDVYVVRR